MSNRPLDRVSDDELNGRLNAVRAMIRRTRKHLGDTRDAEVELCYLEREMEVRENRRMAHSKYLSETYSETSFSSQEEEEALNEYMETGEQVQIQ